ncbi:MAG: MBL fold metallo-hydrolase [Peptococcaceae bacterium]|nr:MBL fold metallo-hydrolase [Peptococcaceae bacterium]
MIEEILPNIFVIKVPLPGNPLQAINAYLVRGRERNLLIDTGFNRVECRTALLNGLRSLDVSLDETDIFLTHMHADHSGLISAVATDKSAIYCSELDAKRINMALTPTYWPKNLAYAESHGFPLHKYRDELLQHPSQRYGPDKQHEFSIIGEGDVLEVDGYSFVAVETPGHTPGHICLYEPDKKILISGDHILGDITPNITMFYGGLADPLGRYLQSLDKVNSMEISVGLPGHQGIIRDVHRRIGELKQHYENRLGEVLTVLQSGMKNAFQVAGGVTWDIPCAWDRFPLQQLWFATGEIISHLEHLRQRNKVRRLEHGGVLLFELVK